jgi:hypothetical protein
VPVVSIHDLDFDFNFENQFVRKLLSLSNRTRGGAATTTDEPPESE